MLAQCCTDCIVFSAGVAKPCTHAGLATCVEVLGYLVHYPCLAAANGATTPGGGATYTLVADSSVNNEEPSSLCAQADAGSAGMFCLWPCGGNVARKTQKYIWTDPDKDADACTQVHSLC